MAENRVSFNYRGRYFDNGVSRDQAKELLFVFHGQGQLPEYFIKKFNCLKDLSIRVIAPEGLSRYYLEGNYGRVGASWMTKEDRLNDIDNYVHFINEVYKSEAIESGFKQKITALGFSQGAATVSRWIGQKQIEFQRLILWSGMFPPDLDWNFSRDKLKGKEVYFVYGKSDPYLSDDRFKEQEHLSNQLGISPEIVAFDGVHTIENEPLLEIFS